MQGVAQNQQHGCGAAFDWGHAQRYMPNVEDARRRVEQAVQDLERVEGTVAAAAEKWERLREFAKTVEPIIDLDRTIPEPIVHRMSLMDELRRQPERNSPLAHFFQLRPSLRRLHVLPDLIELYQWLHLNLEHLLTKKRALDLPVGVLFNKEKLSARFSKSHVGHIIALWTRAKKGFNQFAAGMGYQIGAGACDAANPLEPITDETPVLRLLTDDQDETAGNDDLFRAIKKMIEIYNDFVQRTENEGTVRTEILPASITRSNIMMGDRMPFERTLSDEETSSYFEDLVDCYWHDGKFDLTTLKDDINDLFLRRSPRISDPNKTLRKVFSFRAVSDDRTAGESKITGHGDSGSIVESIREALQSMEITESRGLAATLLATYHTASYRLLSDMLVGLKVVVDVAVQQRDPKAGVKAVLRLISPDANDNDGLLKPVNMHEADGSQQEFLLRASLPDSLAIAYFVHKQLAVEAFSYAHHPLSVKMPLHDRIKQSLITNLKKVPRLPEQLQELVNSLAHAEHDMLRNHESTKPIRDYLVATMGYEPSDRLIAALGEDVCVQHYVELRQTLHQLAVEHASLPPASDSDELQINWRWTTGVVPGLLDEAETQVDDEEVFHERPPPRRLWFESEDDFAHGVEESKLEDDDTQHADKCVCLQRAWRNYYRRQGGGGSSRRRAKALWQRVRSDILQRMREGLPPLLDDHNIAAVADEMPASAPILNDAEIVSPRSTLVAIAMIIVVGMSIWYHFFGLIVKSCLVAGFILGATVWVRKHAEDALNTARAVPRVYWTGMICVVAVVAVFRATSLYFPHRPSELPQHFATHQQQPSEQQQPLESIDPMLVEWVREQKLPDTFVSSLNDYGVRYKDDLLELDAEDISTLKETLQRFDQKRLDKCLAQLQSWEGDSLAQLQSLEDGSELKSLQGSEREGDNTEGTRSDVPVCDNNDFRDGSGACTHQPPN